jgi:hypothetical protein
MREQRIFLTRIHGKRQTAINEWGVYPMFI